jgi:hypothetical protein
MASQQRYLFVWEDIWTDYTPGIAFAVAANIDDAYAAMEKAMKDMPWRMNEIRNNTPKIFNVKQDYANGVSGLDNHC